MRALLILLALCWCSEASARDALAQLNWRRARVGLPAYKADPSLQAAAEASAQAQASRGRMFHNRHIGTRSGVGWDSQNDPEGRRFYTCCSFARGSAWAGAAVAVGRNGQTYYSLDLRNSPSGRSGSRCPRCGRVH